MADFVGCAKEIGKCILTQCIQPPVKRHFDYWWCFDDNIQSLKAEFGKLNWQIYDLKENIKGAELRLEVVKPQVKKWLEASTEKLKEALLPDDDIPKAWDLISRYSMGKNAKQTADKIAKFLNEGMIGICGMGGIGKTTMAKRIRERVKEKDLFDEVVLVTVSQTVDILNMQSEIAEWLNLELYEKHISTRAAKLRARLTDTTRKLIILDDVWDSSLKLDEELGIRIFETCKVLLTSRSRDTCNPFKNIVVFDLKILEEEEAWILFEDNASKCVEDSDFRDVAKELVKECNGLPIALVTVGIALKDKTTIGGWKDSLEQLRRCNPIDLPKVLEDVYKPLKLSYDFLKNESLKKLFLMCCLFPEDYDIPIEQLTWCSMGLKLFDDITNLEGARNRTESLVDELRSRSLLITCGNKLHVKMHDVVRDVAIFIGSLEKDGFLKSLTSIKSSSDENGNWMSHIDENCNWMSVDISNNQMEVPVLSRFPKLRLLMLHTLSSKQFSYKLYDMSRTSFEGMEDLNVLSFQSNYSNIYLPEPNFQSSISLPPSLGLLKNLQTLRLLYCNVENISVIGELTSLKILSCSLCPNITELPAETERLKGLRLLELNGCSSLRRIPFGIISCLSCLEELKIRKSFSAWETAGGERRNASLKELEHLRNLTCLEIDISDCTSSAQEIRLPYKELVRYRIRINDEDFDYFGDGYGDYEKVMIVNLAGAAGNWIRLLARKAESLSLIGDGSDNINLAEMENLKSLRFTKCSRVKKLEDTTRTRLLQLEVLNIVDCESMEQVFWNEARDNNTNGCIEFPKLKKLRLQNLPHLTAFCQGLQNMAIKFPNLTQLEMAGLPNLENSCFHLFCNPMDVSFDNLQSIEIGECYNLRRLSSVSAAGRYLLQLESLGIWECELMEQVFWNDNDTEGCIHFPKLKYLSLNNLPNLTAFCQNIIIIMPNLTKMRIESLPKLNSLFPLDSETIESSCFHLFSNPKDVSFRNLQSIFIGGCANLRCLFSTATIYLLQLEYLWIEDCNSMEQVIWNEDTYNNTYGCIEFLKLKTLILWNLPNLTAFCQGLENITIKFPNLTKLDIRRLPKLNSLFTLNSEAVVGHDHNTCFHFLCNLKVEMGSLLYLTLVGSQDTTNIGNIWCSQIPNNFFNNLETLEIGFMNDIRSLMSTSIAKNLKCIQHLKIWTCEEMVEVIEIDDDDKQVVNINCLFPNLKSLDIGDMPKMRWFWQWNHALELSLLEEVSISSCPMMETFTVGSINTPNIRKIEVNSEQIHDRKDLNDVIHHIWTESQDKSKTNEEEEEEEEEEEDKDESKDELNNERK